MKIVSVVVLAASAIFNGGSNKAAAFSPTVALTLTSAALWKKTTPSASVLKSTNEGTESTTTVTVAKEEEVTVDGSNTSKTTIRNATIASQLSSKSLAGLDTLVASSKQVLSSSQLQSAAAVFVGTILTYYLNNHRNWGPIVASSMVGILSAVSLPLPLALASFCGSFAGMAKAAVISSRSMVPSVLLLGAVCAAMMAIFDRQKWLVGVGGRLGFIAQCACTLQFVFFSLMIDKAVTPGVAALVGSFGDPIQVLSKMPLVCLSTLGGALFMSFWKEAMAEKVRENKDDRAKSQLYQRLSNSVAASSIVGLLAGALLPAGVAGPAFCGSFIAMSAPAKLETYGSLIGASIMGGLCQQAMSGVLQGGWGGRLGTASLLGVLSYRLIVSFSKRTIRPATKTA